MCNSCGCENKLNEVITEEKVEITIPVEDSCECGCDDECMPGGCECGCC